MPHLPPMSNTDILLACVAGLLLILLIAMLSLLFRKDGTKQLRKSFDSFKESSTQSERALRAELAQTLADIRALREEMTSRVTSLVKSMIPASTVTKSIDTRLDRVREAVETRLKTLMEESTRLLDTAGENTQAIATAQREEVAGALREIKEALVTTLDRYSQYMTSLINRSLTENTEHQRTQIARMVEGLTQLVNATEEKLDTYRHETDARMKRIQAESAVVAKFQTATRAFGVALASEFDSNSNGRADELAPPFPHHRQELDS